MKKTIAKRLLTLVSSVIDNINRDEKRISDGEATTIKSTLAEGILSILNEPDIYRKYGAIIDSLEYSELNENYIKNGGLIDSLRHIPYDEYELKKCNEIIEKEKEFIEFLKRIENEIDSIFEKKNVYSHTLIDKSLFGKLFLKIFLLKLENRPFETKDFTTYQAEVIVEGIIKQRNIPCEICGENRAIDQCHIIPSALGGKLEADNLLYLCPTHHRLFDNTMLSHQEWDKINWKRKPEIIQKFALLVFKKANDAFWAQVNNGNFDKMTGLDIGGKDFFGDLLDKIISEIQKTHEIYQKEILQKYPVHLRKCIQKILKLLTEYKIVSKRKIKSEYIYSFLKKPNDTELTKIIRFI